MNRRIQGYGWHRDLPDPRDLLYNLKASILSATEVAAKSDLSDGMPPIYDQARLGSCTANAAAAVMEQAQRRRGEAEGFVTPSRLFVYYNERVLEGSDPSQDTGGQVRDAIKVLATRGAPPETAWPYSDANPGPFQEKPPRSVYAMAKRYKAIRYQRIVPGPGATIRTALTNDMPIAFGFPVPSNFEDPSWDPTSTPLRIPDASTEFVGGHAVVIVGHDYSRTRFPHNDVFKIRNSWGAAWGDAGHFWMDSHWFNPDDALASDLWVVETVS